MTNESTGLVIHETLEQGSDEWHAARCGILTASEVKLIITPTLKIASNDKERQHLYELLAQRISQYVEPCYIGDAMLRGYEDEIEARAIYDEKYAPVREVGFITNDKWGFRLGYSPDGVVGDDGLIEIKSRVQKYQVETFVKHVPEQTIPSDYLMQCQSGMMIAERKWIDFISYSAGLPMAVIRVHPDDKIQHAIVEAAAGFEARINAAKAIYMDSAKDAFPTERKDYEEITL